MKDTGNLMKRILFIIPSLKGGGAERILINLLSLLKENSRFQITLCCILKKGVYLDSLPDEIDVVFLFKSERLSKIVEKCTRDFGLKPLLKARVKQKLKGDFHVGISFLDSIYSEILCYGCTRIDKKIIVIHSSYMSYSNKSKFIHGRHKKRLLKRYNNADTIVSVSNDVQREFTEAFGQFRDMKVIYNPINVEQILEKAQKDVPEVSGSKNRLLTIGSYIPVKNHCRLIRAAELLAKDGIDFHLRIMGKGRLRSKLEAMICEKQLHDYVELTGFIENPYPNLKSADIFILSSLSEGLPTAICEAMVLGVPVVATNCPGAREILDDGKYGILTEQSDFELYKGIKRMINMEERAHFIARSMERAKIFDDQYALKEYLSILE
jgi:glycosyltransferase involved in cell wall biosynthesis